MALKSTVYKLSLNVSDLDRNVYDDFALSVAKHPSETLERMMLRVAAFALNADAQLAFGRGISTDDEPDLWQKDLTGVIESWIDLGTPDPDRVRKACGRAQRVIVYAYGERALRAWWDKHSAVFSRLERLTVCSIDDEALAALGHLAAPGMALQCTISGGELWITDGGRSLEISPKVLTD